MLRAVHTGDGAVQLSYAITLDGVLLSSLAITYQIHHRTTGVVVAAGSFSTDAVTGLATADVVISDPPATLRVLSSLSYVGLTVEEDADILNLAAAVASIAEVEDVIEVQRLEPIIEVQTIVSIPSVGVTESAVSVLDTTQQITVVEL